MDLERTMYIAASGMKVQGERIKVISENIANARSMGETPHDLPYRRKIIHFKEMMDRNLGFKTVRVNKVDLDPSEFGREYRPGHPAADGSGYVLIPNVKTLVEMNDMREAQRSYQANLNLLDATKRMLQKTAEMLRN